MFLKTKKYFFIDKHISYVFCFKKQTLNYLTSYDTRYAKSHSLQIYLSCVFFLIFFSIFILFIFQNRKIMGKIKKNTNIWYYIYILLINALNGVLFMEVAFNFMLWTAV